MQGTSPMIPVLQRNPERGIDANIGTQRAFYEAIHASLNSAKPVEEFIIPARTGKAWKLRAGQACRIVVTEGPQVADFNAWNLSNPKERFWAARTRQLHGPHVATFDRLWSCLPFLRPMLTITNETIRYGLDQDGGGCHDLLGSRCDPYGHKLLTGEDTDCTCHTNLTKAIHDFGLTEEDVHDVINIFQVTGIDRTNNQCFVKASPGRTGDYFEFFAEMDLLCAVSACPQGDLSAPVTGPQAHDVTARCYPLGIQIFNVAASLIETWTPPQPVQFDGLAGYRRGASTENRPS